MGAFSIFRDKRTKKSKRETPTVNKHYIKLARKTAFVRYLCIILVVLFAIYSLSFHASEISIENFRYMLKFINLGDEAEAPVGNLIAFDGSAGNRGISFKGDLAVLNENGITITGWDSEIILRDTFSTDHPKVTENGINLFCYDLGGKDLRIYNSYSLISKISYDYPIYWFAASENGGFAVVSSAKGYRSAVYVYDKEYRLLYSKMLSDKYVDFVDISASGKEFITASHYSDNGNLVTLVTKSSVESEQPLFEQQFVGEIPLGLYYTESGYCLITSDAMRMFDNENNLTCTISFAGRSLLSGRVFGDRALLSYSLEGLSGGTESVLYSIGGEILFSHKNDRAVSDTTVIGNTFYALSPGTLAICDMVTGENKTYTIPTSYSSLVPDGERIILFSENQAEYFIPDTYEENKQ